MKKLFPFSFIVYLLCSFPAHAEKDWRAYWISHETSESHPNQWLTYTKHYDIRTVPDVAIARISADSKYWLWINGEMVVFEGGLKRGPEPDATYYDEVDIAPYLKAGDNKIAALVWFFGRNGFSHVSSGRAGFIFDCQTPEVDLLSDNTWQCDTYGAFQNTDAPHPNYRLPESNIRFDAREAKNGWHLPGHDFIREHSMRIADANGAPYGKLVKRPIPLWKDYGLKDYVSTERRGDTLYCKLPYNAQVTPWFKVRAEKAGLNIGMITDNYLTGNGDQNSVRAEYITVAGEQEYESLGWMSGHIMKYAIPEGVEVLEVKFRETGYNTEFAGSFTCDDPFYNELWKRAARTMYVNMRDTYYDCPERERAQWWGDEVNELEQAFYCFDPAAQQLATKGVRELINWQRADGVIFSPVPAGSWTRELPLQMLASVGWYGFHDQYYFSGDDSFIADIYDGMHRYLHDVWQIGDDGLVVFREGDWNWGDWGPNQDMLLMTNCWYYLALKGEREFARILGRQSDVKMITDIMDGIAANFDAKFWTGTAYRDPDYRLETDDRGQALAVLSGLASEDKYPALLEVLKKEYHAGPYMEKFVLEALFQMGAAEFALQRIKDRYAEMMASDYSTLYEVWKFKATPTDANTNNHAWSGGPLILLSQRVCGIQPTSPGFKTFRVAPQMGGLSTATATVSSVNGVITASVNRKGQHYTIDVTVPEGTTAEVVFPSGKIVPLTAGTHTVKGK